MSVAQGICLLGRAISHGSIRLELPESSSCPLGATICLPQDTAFSGPLLIAEADSHSSVCRRPAAGSMRRSTA